MAHGSELAQKARSIACTYLRVLRNSLGRVQERLTICDAPLHKDVFLLQFFQKAKIVFTFFNFSKPKLRSPYLHVFCRVFWSKIELKMVSA